MDEVFACETTIARPRAEVWAVLTDWDRAPAWMDGVESLVADGPLATGTSLTLRSGGRDRPATVHAVDPGRGLTIRSRSRGITADYAYVLEAADGDPGTTRVTLVAHCATRGVARVLAPLLKDAMRRTDSGQLEALRSLLEVGDLGTS